MTEHQLAEILKGMYSDAPKGEKVANIYLFGIKYATIISEEKLSVKEIVNASGLPSSYVVEVSGGIKLSKYVVPR